MLDAYYLLNELDSKVSGDLTSIDYDEAGSNNKQARLSDNNNLKRKYNRTMMN